jgi:hypothetical protein
MTSPLLSSELRRFIYTIGSIPELEAMLLLHQAPAQVWDENSIAKRLYVNNQEAAVMLQKIAAAGICQFVQQPASGFTYAPASAELGELIDQLASYYPRNLIEVTNMIHSKASTNSRVQQFADAFKIFKDK